MYSGLNKRQLLGRLYANATIYGVGIILVRAGSILLLPLYWMRLDPTDYGIIGLTQMLVLFLMPVLGLGLQDTVQRFYYDWPAEERPRYLAAVWLFSLGISGILCAALELLGADLFGVLFKQVTFDPYLRIAVWTAFVTNLTMIPLTLLRVREQLRHYTFIVFGQFITQASITLYFIFWLDMGVLGYLLGTLAGAATWAVYFTLYMAREIRWPSASRYLTGPLRYALPIAPAALLEGLNSVMDRFFLDKFVGLRQIGIYTLAHQFGQGFNVFNQIMKNSWFPFIYRVTSERSDAPSVLARFSLYYLAILTLPALGIALLSKELIVWFGDEKYFGIYEYIPAFVLLYFVHAIGHSFGRGLDLAKRMGYTPAIQAVGLTVGVTAIWLLVPVYGLWGAVGGMLAANIARTSLLVYLAHHFYPRPIVARQIVTMAVIILAAFYLASQIDLASLMLDTLAKITAIIIAMALMIWFVLDRGSAIALAGNVVRSLKARIF